MMSVSRAWAYSCLSDMNVTQHDCDGKTKIKWKYLDGAWEDIPISMTLSRM